MHAQGEEDRGKPDAHFENSFNLPHFVNVSCVHIRRKRSEICVWNAIMKLNFPYFLAEMPISALDIRAFSTSLLLRPRLLQEL